MKQLALALTALSFTIPLALTIAPPAFADDTATPPVQVRYPPSAVRVKLIIGGLAISGLAYAAAFGTATNWSDIPGSASLKAPLIGPWLALGQSGCAPTDPDCGAKVYVRGVAYALDGIVQLAGLGLIAEGIFMKTEATTPAKKPSLAWSLPGGVTVLPTPTIGARFTGLGFTGTF